MEDEDLFLDNARLQKMIALGIYDDKTVDKMKNIKNSDFKDNNDNSNKSQTVSRPTARTDNPSDGLVGGRSFVRNRVPITGQSADGWKPPNHSRGFRPLQNSSFKWSELSDNKRPRSPSADGREDFRNRIRDGIQTKIQRNEIEQKLNSDYMNDKNSGNSCIDTDLRPKSDIDSRLRDTDFRPNRTESHNSGQYLPIITSTANDEDMRGQRGRGGRGQGTQRPFNARSRNFYGERRNESSGARPQAPDDIDDFINQANKQLGQISPQKGRAGMSMRGRGSDRRPYQRQRPNNSYNRIPTEVGYLRPNLSQNAFNSQTNETFSRRPAEQQFGSSVPQVLEVPEDNSGVDPQPNPSKHIAILRETVEELAKSNLYCQYCDCYLSSLVEVNSHIGTVSHSQNMAKKMMEDNDKSRPNSDPNTSFSDKRIESAQQSRPISQTVVERVPTGMAALVQMIEQSKRITLKSLTDMDSYEITSDSEAALAKELAKLLTNELLSYKMNLMPDTVKEALKHQGIGLLSSVINN